MGDVVTINIMNKKIKVLIGTLAISIVLFAILFNFSTYSTYPYGPPTGCPNICKGVSIKLSCDDGIINECTYLCLGRLRSSCGD